MYTKVALGFHSQLINFLKRYWPTYIVINAPYENIYGEVEEKQNHWSSYFQIARKYLTSIITEPLNIRLTSSIYGYKVIV